MKMGNRYLYRILAMLLKNERKSILQLLLVTIMPPNSLVITRSKIMDHLKNANIIVYLLNGFILLILLIMPSIGFAEDIHPFTIPNSPDGNTWRVYNDSQSPGSIEGVTSETAYAVDAIDMPDLNNVWEQGEKFQFKTLAIAYAKSFIIPGAAIQEVDNEIRIPLYVDESGIYSLSMLIDLSQTVSSLKVKYGGQAHPSYMRYNQKLCLEG